MTGVDLRWAEAETPTPSQYWREAEAQRRQALCAEILLLAAPDLGLWATYPDGRVILELLTPLNAARRGQLLLDVETLLKMQIDHGLTVYLRPVQDRNAARQFRGVQVLDD